MEKTAMIFSGNVSRASQEELRQLWGVSEVQDYGKYLGLPPAIGRSKTNAFSEIKQKVWKKLQGWKENMLSQGGREVLIKAVALSLPTYSMSCFLLPISLCSEFESMMVKFWWSQKKDEKRIHWMSWRKMCEQKGKGGFGFKDLHVFNLSLLAKQGWRIMQETDSLIHKVSKAKYFPHGVFLEAGLGKRPSSPGEAFGGPRS
ncbi:hypothetical protein F2P56_034003 [Juglans regia]|uniref:Uncharacterized mitochondrial protein AtMg00310-like n=2 Tax=Juglans regia TaxID=51240 RepID=A0A2I4EKC7_JUGRE|nr:uncharacterized mitochondrial protein AtMg00310-like [Juglans regia]KAF5444911.1 hypothetical protein F2P56_034003 [Juglans regia]